MKTEMLEKVKCVCGKYECQYLAMHIAEVENYKVPGKISPIIGQYRGMTFFLVIGSTIYKEDIKDVFFIDKPPNYNYVNCYIYYDNQEEFSGDLFGSETYNSGKIIGVDTMHHYNREMNIMERSEDAINQIISIIDDVID